MGATCVDATFTCPDLTTFTRLDELGLEVIWQRLDARLRCPRVPSRRSRHLGGLVSSVRMQRGTARQRDDAAGHGPALSVHRLRACVALGHLPCH
jgi:hypothetical protein